MTENKITVHEKTFPIAWGDMDALGHVNNARYFDYFQEARIEWLRELKIKMTEQMGPVVVHVACTYLKPVVYPATVTLRSRIYNMGNSSMMMDHDLYQDEVLMAQGSCKVVWVDYTKNKSVPLPDSIRTSFEASR
ncbi:acyl-CoA thioesterase [Legionella lytica]|uniref:Acyl-CoA thioesterase n=1 Tax=Legionella lytica TaxID=96232 RepID=A0ABY4Y8F5_9GAMM|nr:thioesterase family protein [Legionella lytica]USQ13908.1 acyl-CoA thioesterase [Legionella lytica]